MNYQSTPITFLKIFLVLSALFLNACGSGGKVSDPPQAPDPSVIIKNEKVIIEWPVVADAFFYNIYWDEVPGVSASSPNKIKSEDNSVSIEGLTNDRTYFFVVTAVGVGNESVVSIEMEATPIAPPLMPQNLNVNPADEAINLTWQAVDKAIEYQIYLTSDNNTVSFVTTETTYTLKNLENGKPYSVLVKAINPSGESPDTIPVQAIPTSTLKLASGATHSCAIRADHSLWCWGSNIYGELGNGTTDSSLSPIRIGEDNDWINIGLGSSFSCASKTDGSLWCWGDNYSNQLGIAESGEIHVPTLIELDEEVSQISITSQAQTTCEINIQGALYCWGLNIFGQAGVGNTDFTVPPSLVGDLGEWSFISVGALHTCGIKQDSTLWCWGANFFGQLGDGTYEDKLSPNTIGGFDSWFQATVGPTSSCAITNEGDLWCWGDNSSGQLGDGTDLQHIEPIAIASSESWLSLSLGGSFSCAINTDQSLWCWGDNSEGQLGNGTTDNNYFPSQTNSLNDWASISTGDTHACGLKINGDVYCWGNGEYGQLGVNDAVDIDSETPWLLDPTLVEFP